MRLGNKFYRFCEDKAMSKGKYYSLEEAREARDLKGFAKEHPSKGDRGLFEGTLERMAKNLPVEKEKSNAENSD